MHGLSTYCTYSCTIVHVQKSTHLINPKVQLHELLYVCTYTYTYTKKLIQKQYTINPLISRVHCLNGEPHFSQKNQVLQLGCHLHVGDWELAKVFQNLLARKKSLKIGFGKYEMRSYFLKRSRNGVYCVRYHLCNPPTPPH